LKHDELTAAENLSGKTDQSVRSAIWFCAAMMWRYLLGGK